MKKTLPITMLLLLVSGALACKSYTKALEDSVAAADETAALSAVRTIGVAEQTYFTSNNGTYGTFDQLVNAGYLDSRFNSEKPKIKGYEISLVISGKSEVDSSYTVNADPQPPLRGRHFFTDSATSLIRVNPSQSAGPSDPPLNQ